MHTFPWCFGIVYYYRYISCMENMFAEQVVEFPWVYVWLPTTTVRKFKPTLKKLRWSWLGVKGTAMQVKTTANTPTWPILYFFVQLHYQSVSILGEQNPAVQGWMAKLLKGIQCHCSPCWKDTIVGLWAKRCLTKWWKIMIFLISSAEMVCCSTFF